MTHKRYDVFEYSLSRTKVIMSVASTYTKVGINMPVIEACISCGTDYCDMSCEPVFIRNVIDQFHNVA